MALRETVAIRRDNGHRSVIARDDYDPAKHKLWEDADAVQVKTEEVAQEVAPVPKRKGRTRRG